MDYCIGHFKKDPRSPTLRTGIQFWEHFAGDDTIKDQYKQFKMVVTQMQSLGITDTIEGPNEEVQERLKEATLKAKLSGKSWAGSSTADAAAQSEGEESVASSNDDMELNTYNSLYLKYSELDFKWRGVVEQSSLGQYAYHGPQAARAHLRGASRSLHWGRSDISGQVSPVME